MSKNVAVILAGGSGLRMGTGGIPKQFLKMNGKPILFHTIEHFQKHEEIDEIVIVSVKDWLEYIWQQVKIYNFSKVTAIVEGGDTSQDSAYNGLLKARENNSADSIVVIHDGVRPIITAQVISDNIDSVKKFGTAITVSPCSETIIISQDSENIAEMPYRKHAYLGQCPQSFYLGDIIKVHEETRKVNPGYENIVDACTLFNEAGKKLHLVMGNKGNIKVTTPEDYYVVEAIMKYRENEEVFGFSVAESIKK